MSTHYSKTNKLARINKGELQQTDHPLVKCTKLPDFWRMKKSLGELFCVYFLDNFVQDDTKVTIQAGNIKCPHACMKNNEAYVKNGIVEFLDLRFNSTSGRDTKFHVFIQIHSSQPLNVTYLNAIKISVDGPRPKRNPNKANKVKRIDDKYGPLAADFSDPEYHQNTKRKFDSCFIEHRMRMADFLDDSLRSKKLKIDQKSIGNNFDLHNMIFENNSKPNSIFSMQNLHLLVETALRLKHSKRCETIGGQASGLNQIINTTQSYPYNSSNFDKFQYSISSPNSNSNCSDFSAISSNSPQSVMSTSPQLPALRLNENAHLFHYENQHTDFVSQMQHPSLYPLLTPHSPFVLVPQNWPAQFCLFSTVFK